MRRGVGSVRRQDKKKTFIIIALFVVCLAAVGWYAVSESLVFSADGVKLPFFDRKEEQEPSELPPVTITTEETTTEAPTESTTAAPVKTELTKLSTKWINMENLASQSFVDSLISQGVEQVLVTVKDKDGLVHIPMTDGVYKSENLVAKDAEVIASSIKKLKDNGVYLIVGVSALRDDALVRNHRGEAVTANGTTLWLDRDRLTWFIPNSTTNVTALSELCEELGELGVDEVMFTNFSYPYIGKTELIYGKPDEKLLAQMAESLSGVELVKSFVYVTAQGTDVTGQNISLLEKHFDRIMVSGKPGDEAAQAVESQLGDKSKMVYIVGAAAEAGSGVDYIYTK